MELPVGEQRVARGGGRQNRAVEHTPRKMQRARSRTSQPLDLKPLSRQETRQVRARERRR
jgi:hypothetical protein